MAGIKPTEKSRLSSGWEIQIRAAALFFYTQVRNYLYTYVFNRKV